MNENEYRWQDRFLDVLGRFDSALVGEIIERTLRYRSNKAMVAPVLRFAVNLDRPDLIAPLLPNAGDGPSFEDVAWENEELVRLLLRRDARERFGDKSLIDFVRGMDDPGTLKIDSETLRSVYCRYQYTPSFLPEVVGHCPVLDELVVEEQAIWLDILEALLATGVIAEDISGHTWHEAFDSAVRGGHLEATQLFLKHGASPNLMVGFDYIIITSLSRRKIYNALAAAGGKIPWAAVDDFEDSEITAIWHQIAGSARDMLADAVASGEFSPRRLNYFLGQTAGDRSIETVQFFLDAGADIDAAFSRKFFRAYSDQEGSKEEFGNVDMLRFLLESGASMGEAMFKATSQNNRQALTWLINRGGNIDTPNRKGKTALMIAAYRYDIHGEMLDFVLEQGPDINLADYAGSTALSMAIARVGVTSWRKKNDDDESRALAISAKNIAVIKRLLDAGADPNGGFGQTPLMKAAKGGFPAAISLLLKAGANVNTVLEDGDTAWRIANSHGHHDIAKMLEEAGAREPDLSRTDLRAAILWGRIDDALRLIEQGVDIEQLDTRRRTPLFAALMEGGAIDIVERLVKKGAHASGVISGSEWSQNTSPLQKAIDLTRPDLVRMMLNHTTDAGAAKDAWLTLWIAAYPLIWGHMEDDYTPENQAKSMDILRQLLDAGLSADGRNIHQGITLLQAATSMNNVNVMKVLVEYGADLDLRSEAEHRKGYTALHDACANLDVEAVEYLLECGADPNTVSDCGTFPLYDACHTSDWDLLDRLSSLSESNEQTISLKDDENTCHIVKLLLDHGADIHIEQNNERHSVLRQARATVILTEPRCEMIRLLLDADAVD